MADGDVIVISGIDTVGIDRTENDLTVRVLAGAEVLDDTDEGTAIRLTGSRAIVQIAGLVESATLPSSQFPIVIYAGADSHIDVSETGIVRSVQDPASILWAGYTTFGVIVGEGSVFINRGLITGADYAVGGRGRFLNVGIIEAVMGAGDDFAEFVNEGTIKVGMPTTTPPSYGTISALGTRTVGLIVNRGDISVIADWRDGMAIGMTNGGMTFNEGTYFVSADNAKGLFSLTDDNVLYNTGSFRVVADGNEFHDGDAFGYDSDGEGEFHNSGLFEITSTGTAAGARFYNGGFFVNEASGIIRVTGSLYVSAISYNSGGTLIGMTAINHGLIEVTNIDGGDAFAFNGYNDQFHADFRLENTGTIIANVILYNTDRAFSQGVYYRPDGKDDVINSGTMTGDLFFRFDADTLTNSGIITGLVDMGADNDLVLNTGAIVGVLDLGDGDDVVNGFGSVSGSVIGGAGNDLISLGSASLVDGGDGDDVITLGPGFLSGQIEGGLGVDALTPNGDLSLLTISGVEILDTSAGLVTATAAQFESFDVIRFSAAQEGVAAQLRLSTAGTVDLTDELFGRRVIFTGSSGNDVITTSNGNDTIDGGDGNDILSGGAGVDTLIGGLGDDILIGGDNTDFIVDLSGIVSIDGGAGNEQITLGAAVVSGTVDGGVGTDQLTKGGSIAGLSLTSIEILNTNGGIVTGSAAQFESFDTIRYSAGQLSTAISLVMSQAGTVDLTDELLGRRVIFVGTSGNDTITTSNGSDNIDGGAGDDTLSGGLGVDTLIGGLGNDTLSGGDGGDFIVDLSGVMAIDAGDGDDVMTVGAAVSSGTIAGGLGTDQLNKGGAINGLTITGIEIVNTNGGTLLATAAQLESFDTIRFSAALATSAVSLALSEAGTVDLTDELLGRRALFAGSSGNDTITTSNGSDQIDGGDGDDVLSGGAGVDTLIGGLGNDTLDGGDGNDFIVDLSGVVAIDGGDGDDIITVSALITAGSVAGGLGTADQLNKSGNLSAITVSGIEILNTNGGTLIATAAQLESFDTIRFSAAQTTATISLVQAGAGTVDLTDEVLGRRVLYVGSSGNDVVALSNGDDRLDGGSGDDTLNGGAGADTVSGGLGDDLIVQGSTDGRDSIDGGAGTDTYQLNGTAAAETFRIMTRAEAVLAGITGLAGATEIVITKDGTDTASVIAELNDVEEIQINTLLTTANNGNGAVDGGTDTGDTIIVIGDFTTTSLAYSTIHIAGSSANDTVDISGLSSAHRIVFDANGGADSLIGAVRPQDVVTGIPGISASLLSTNNLHVGAGIESDFDLMHLMASNLSSSQALPDDATLRSGLEDPSMAMPGHASPFDHAISLIDRADTADTRIHQVVTDHALV